MKKNNMLCLRKGNTSCIVFSAILIILGGCTNGSVVENESTLSFVQSESDTDYEQESSSEWKYVDYNEMTTEQILAVCLNTPYMSQINMFNSYKQAIDTFMHREKAFRILSEREDSPEILMERIRNYKQSASDVQEECENFNKETFMFAMLRYLYVQDRLSKEEFNEAEKLHWQHMSEHDVFLGGESIPYDPDMEGVYFDEKDGM